MWQRTQPSRLHLLCEKKRQDNYNQNKTLASLYLFYFILIVVIITIFSLKLEKLFCCTVASKCNAPYGCSTAPS